MNRVLLIFLCLGVSVATVLNTLFKENRNFLQLTLGSLGVIVFLVLFIKGLEK